MRDTWSHPDIVVEPSHIDLPFRQLPAHLTAEEEMLAAVVPITSISWARDNMPDGGYPASEHAVGDVDPLQFVAQQPRHAHRRSPDLELL
jgi:hypothetical protein